jgi:hypothetical protein
LHLKNELKDEIKQQNARLSELNKDSRAFFFILENQSLFLSPNLNGIIK